MPILDFDRLEAIDAAAYQATRPFPWTNPEGLLHPAGYRALCETLPDLSLFEQVYGVERAHGQDPHDRYNLEYSEDVPLSDPWREFIAELSDGRYHAQLCRIVGASAIDIRFHWHYQPRGCSVSPHCDNRRKLGSHLFYFNPPEEWDPSWGGETLILDDGGRFDRRSAPGFEDFERVVEARCVGNQSLLFTRRGNAWHGVREILCPEDHMRRIFLVVLNRVKPLERLRRRVLGVAAPPPGREGAAPSPSLERARREGAGGVSAG